MGTDVGRITAAALPRRRAAVTDNGHVSDTEHGHFSHQHFFGKNNDGTHGVLSVNSPYPSHFSFGSTDERSRIHSSPERLRRSDSQTLLNRVPEDGTMEFEHGEESRHTNEPPVDQDEQEDEELVLDAQLAARGLYRGSYHRLMALYTFAPFTWLITFVFLVLLPLLVYPIDDETIPRPPTFPYAPYLPFPIPEFLVSAALWSFTYLTREPIYSLFTSLTSPFTSIPPTLPLLASTAVHTVLSIIIQLSTVPLLLISQYQALDYPAAWDPAFRRVWWAALGWSTAEAVVGIRQGYENIALYQDVLVSIRPVFSRSGHSGSNSPQASKSTSTSASVRAGNSDIDLLNRDVEDDVYGPRSFYDDGEQDALLPRGSGSTRHEFELEETIKSQVDRDIEKLIALKNREELEEIYGIPVIRIPVFISCLQRVNSVLLTLGIYLVLSSAYLRSTIAMTPRPITTHNPTTTNTPLLITLPLVLLIQYSLTLLHTTLVLPRIGVHTVVYAGSLVSLGIFFAGLGLWNALS